MSRIKGENLSLNVDGKIITLKTPSRRNFELNKALLDENKFREFSTNPRAFCKQYDLEIDADISVKLSEKLKGLKNLEEVKKITQEPESPGATVWAVASGAYSVSTSKIAVAF